MSDCLSLLLHFLSSISFLMIDFLVQLFCCGSNAFLLSIFSCLFTCSIRLFTNRSWGLIHPTPVLPECQSVSRFRPAFSLLPYNQSIPNRFFGRSSQTHWKNPFSSFWVINFRGPLKSYEWIPPKQLHVLIFTLQLIRLWGTSKRSTDSDELRILLECVKWEGKTFQCSDRWIKKGSCEKRILQWKKESGFWDRRSAACNLIPASAVDPLYLFSFFSFPVDSLIALSLLCVDLVFTNVIYVQHTPSVCTLYVLQFCLDTHVPFAVHLTCRLTWSRLLCIQSRLKS